MLGVHTAQHHM